MQYWGQGFSPRGEKNRFVLPTDFRSKVKESSGNNRILCLDKHAKLPAMPSSSPTPAWSLDAP